MRKLAAAMVVLVWSGMGSMAAAAAPRPADQPRTMEEVVDRVIVNENHLNQEIRKYAPLVETYIQNQKPDKDLGFVPAGDKYFLGREDFSKGVNLVSLTDADTKGKKTFSGIGNFFSFAMQYLPDGFLQMIFIDTNGFDKQHYKFDYVRREFLGEVRCLVFDVSPQEKAGKGRFLGRIWVEDQDFNIVRFNGGYGGTGHASWYFHFDSWRANAPVGIQRGPRRAGAGVEQDPGGGHGAGRHQDRERPESGAGAAYLGPPGGGKRSRPPAAHRLNGAKG